MNRVSVSWLNHMGVKPYPCTSKDYVMCGINLVDCGSSLLDHALDIIWCTTRLKHLYRYLYPTQFINRYQNGVMYHETQPYIQILYIIIHPLFATKGFDMLYMLMPAGVTPTPGDGPSLRKNVSKLLEDVIYMTTRSSMKTVDSEDAVETNDDKEPTSKLSQYEKSC